MNARPTLLDFGLTEEAVVRHRRRDAYLGRVPVGIAALAGLAAARGCLASFNHPSSPVDWIANGVGALFCGFIGFYVALLACVSVWRPLGRGFGALTAPFRPTDRRIAKFEAALREHEAAVHEHEEALLRRRRDFWRLLNGHRFEHELGALYRRLGYSVTVTKGSGDEGIDLILTRDGVTIIVQCKAHAKPVGPAVVRELWGAMWACGADRCVLASLGGFTPGVTRFAAGKAIELIDIDAVLALEEQAQGGTSAIG